MPGKNLKNLDEDLIREALRLDLEAAAPPPPNYGLRRIEEALAGRGISTARVRRSYLIYTAAGIAACLLIVLGGFGLLRALQPPVPVYEFTAEAEPAVEEFVAFDESHAQAPPEYPPEAPAETELEYSIPEPAADLEREAGPRPDPPVLGEEFILVEELIPVGTGEPFYQGAVYRSGEVELLWVASTAAHEDIENFLFNLGVQLGLKIETAGATNGVLPFEAGGKPGLARRLNGRNQALLVASGRYSVEQLEALLYDLD